MSTRTPRRTVLVVAAALTVGALGACSSGGSVTIPKASGSGHLRIGISFDQPGIGLKDGNTYKGFDVDTAEYVAAKLGVPTSNITWVEADPADRETLIETGKVDMVVSSYSITPEREQKVSFAGPYFVAHQNLLIRRNDTSISGPKTLDQKVLCSVTNTTSAAYIRSHYAGKIKLIEYPTFSKCVSALANGDVDAVTTDDLILAGFAAEPKYKGVLKVLGDGFTDERYGIGVKKGDTELVGKINAALKDFISSGQWKKSLDKNVAPSGYKVPGPPTVGS